METSVSHSICPNPCCFNIFSWPISYPASFTTFPELEFDNTTNLKHNTMLRLCYGMGLRVSELVGLKVTDVDSGNMQVYIRRAKGKKDCYVNL
ncbi:MAG: tyrosine-type recombinase/integrase, partial [Bacteroidetes bacterium]|nr:tyrosine-type recombinase/integrase [Bacteroidota bacterium]